MQVKNEIEVAASAEAAWAVLGERFGQVAEWVSSLDASRLEGELGVGAQRVCRSSQSFGPFPPSVVTERLVEYDPTRMTFRYEATTGLPVMFRHAGNHWRVERNGAAGCRVSWTATVDAAWWAWPLMPFIRIMLRAPMRTFEAELRRAIEIEASSVRDAVAP